jgi:hypothetical protein
MKPRVKRALARLRRRGRRARPLVLDLSAPKVAEVAKARAVAGDRLLVAPVFVLSSIRSGSTLLRVMLNTHSAIHAPHELHLRGLTVQQKTRYVTRAMEELGLDEDQLRYLLWDRVLHRELIRHQKQVLVNKTPSDAFIWRQISECWPDARFIFLLRHPAAITDSWQRARKDWTRDQAAADVLRYMDAMDEARNEHGGLTVKYEDVTIDPAREMQRICTFIDIPYEPSMVDYSQGDHGKFKAGLGDWSPRIKSGKVQPVTKIPTLDETPPALVEVAKNWGYA